MSKYCKFIKLRHDLTANMVIETLGVVAKTGAFERKSRLTL